MKRFVATIAFALVMAAGAAVPALAQYGTTPTNCVGTLNSSGTSTTTYAAGSTIIVRGEAGCAVGGEQVTVTLQSDPVVLGVMAARSDGSYDSTSLGLRIPANTTPGTHTISAIPNSRRDAPYRVSITVTGGAAGTSLPTTGQAIAIWALWGVIVLIAGYVMASASWRYRRESRRVKQMELEVERNTVPTLQQTSAPARAAMSLEPASDPFGDDDTMFLPATPIHTPARFADAEPLFAEPDPEPAPVLTLERDPVQASVAKSTSRTSELLAKLQSEIDAWAEQ